MTKNRYSGQNPSLLLGVAAVAGLAGGLAALLRSSRREPLWKERCKGISHAMLHSTDHLNTNLLLGGLAGGLVAVTAALLLAPKPGSELIQDLTDAFSSHSEEKEEDEEKDDNGENGEDKDESEDKQEEETTELSEREESKSKKGKKSKNNNNLNSATDKNENLADFAKPDEEPRLPFQQL